jgi:hypothetical protein
MKNYLKMITIIAIDSIYNNTNVYNIKGFLETILHIGVFDVYNEIPLDLTLDGLEKIKI